MDCYKIIESIISGVCVGLAITFANWLIDRRRSNKEFQSNLVLVIVELFRNYSAVPNSKESPFLPCQPINFELTAWSSLKGKLTPKLNKSVFLRLEVLYFALKTTMNNHGPKDISDCWIIRNQISRELNELLAISKNDFSQFDKMIRKDEARKSDNENEAKPLKLMHKLRKLRIKSASIHLVSYIRNRVFQHKRQ